jgi:hypothetical protein
VGSGSNRLIIVSVYAFGGSPTTTVSSITCAGTAMTLLCTDNKSGSVGSVRGYTYYLTNPPSGRDNINVTFAANTSSIGGSASFFNVDQTTPIENKNTANGEGTSVSVVGNSSGASRIAYASVGAVRGSVISLTDNASWTTIFRENSVAPSANLRKIVGCYISKNSGNITASWTITNTADWVAQIAVVKPVSAPTGHAETDIVIRENDNTVRAILATGVAQSGNTTTTEQTLSGTYTISAYSVVANTDYLELDFYDNVTTAGSSTAYLKIDNNSIAAGSQTESDNWNFTVTETVIVDITLSNVPVNFGTVNPGTSNVPAADNAHGFPMTIKVESDTNVNVDIYLKGTNWSDGAGHSIGVENCKYDDDNTLGQAPENGQPENTLKLIYPGTANSGYFDNVTPGSSKNVYFWISIPSGQWAGTYTDNVYVKAVKDGIAP